MTTPQRSQARHLSGPLSEIHVAVAGAGPAGLMAAAAAAEAGARVTLLESLHSPGVKLLATGGGRCNVTNTGTIASFLAAYGAAGRFARHAIHAFGPEALQGFLLSRGVPIVAEDGFHVFPRSGRAVEVLDALLHRARELGVEIRTSQGVKSLALRGERLAGLETEGGTVTAERVVVACGGLASPLLGATGAGFRLAAQAGHGLEDPVPALVPLLSPEPWISACAGVSLDAELRMDGPCAAGGSARGELLFTHRGLSGPAALNISGAVSRRLASGGETILRLSLLPGVKEAGWMESFASWQSASGSSLVRTLLGGMLPRRLAGIVCDLAGCPEERAAGLGRASRRALAALLTAMPVRISGTEGWPKAMATSGGVRLDEVDPRSLESRLLPGLFFAGEVLDVHGPCGGYNLQWAFSSGRLAGASAAAPETS